MKNKVRLKKYLAIISIISICILSLFLVIRVYEYKTYTNNFNNKLDMIISKLKDTYPDVSDTEIMEILNSKERYSSSIIEKYGIELSKDSVLLENKESFNRFLCVDAICLIFGIAILVSIFFIYDKRKDKELAKITKYIEEINRRNYSLKIDEISEDELSILKNEIYKTTVMLKENADNSLKGQKQLQRSLEDISHQLKTPLTSILIILDNLLDDPNMEEQVRLDFIKDLKRQVTNISFLVQSLLKLSKLDSNTVNFIKSDKLLKDIVDESIKNVEVVCDLKNISIYTKGNTQAKINCDFMWEVEAVTNIIKNCVEHSDNNSKINIRYEQNNVYSSITIQDFAGGIDKNDLPHIFERFYKGKNASKDSVGIGLALAKTIIENDNGNINVETDNIGTKFIIKYFAL